MPKQIVGKIPEFTNDEPGTEEVKDPVDKQPEDSSVEDDAGNKPADVEKDTPTDLPADKQPADEDKKPQGEDVKDSDTDNQGLLSQRQKLLVEIQELRQTRREERDKPDDKPIVEQKVDDLKDIDPAYLQTVERIIKAKGYVTKEESSNLSNATLQKTVLSEFLKKYPEYDTANDPNDINWKALQRELSFYKVPSDPTAFEKVLLKAHSAISSSKPSKDDRTTDKKLETARLGGGGEKRPSSQTKSLTDEQKNVYRQGGWSEDEIKELET